MNAVHAVIDMAQKARKFETVANDLRLVTEKYNQANEELKDACRVAQKALHNEDLVATGNMGHEQRRNSFLVQLVQAARNV